MKRVRQAGGAAAAGLLLVLAGGCRPAPPPPTAVPGVDVTHYEVALRLDPASHEVVGHARLTLSHDAARTELPLGFGPMAVDSVQVDGRRVEARRAPGRLVVPLSRGQATARVDVWYRGVPEEGLYAGAHAGLAVLYTDGWPDRVGGWLPGVHHPSDPATLALSVEVPAPFEVVGTGVPAGVDTVGTHRRYRWRLDTAAPTYTFAFAVSDFSVAEAALGDTLPIRYYQLAPNAAEAADLARTPAVLAFFSSLLGPYPYGQYASVEVPFGFAGMENASSVFLQARLFALDQAEAVQVHEAAHQWFGNRVVIADWQDLWLSEGHATYLTTLFYEYADGTAAARRRWADMATVPLGEVAFPALVPPPPIEPTAHLTWVPYQKGASVLHLLRLQLGDAAFFRALRTAYTRYAGRPLSTDAYRAVLEEAGGRNLERLFRYWVYGDRLPVLETRWAPSHGVLSWSVREDDGTLAGLPFLLEVEQGGTVRYVEAAAGRVRLAPGTTGPTVRPVGIMMHVVRPDGR